MEHRSDRKRLREAKRALKQEAKRLRKLERQNNRESLESLQGREVAADLEEKAQDAGGDR
jgi:hypothetical protein